MDKAYKVNLIEYERAWGSRVDESKYFSTEEEAKSFVLKFNLENNSPDVPDWYMVAEYIGYVGQLI